MAEQLLASGSKFAKMLNRVSSYARELHFALRAACGWPDFVRLAQNTIKFHLHNARGGRSSRSETFTIKLKISEANAATLTLRPYSGDLFILYEVLALESYRLPNWRLEADKPRVIVDGGANIGITSLYFAARYPNATIYSVEPLPANFSILNANVAHVPRIRPIHACLIGKPQESVQFSTNGPAWGNRIGISGISVPGLTLQQLCEKENINCIDLLKLDIEGSEKEVLANGNFLERVQHMIIELHEDYGFEAFQRDVKPFDIEAALPSPPETRMVTASKRAP